MIKKILDSLFGLALIFIGFSGGLPPKTTDTATVGTILFIAGVCVLVIRMPNFFETN